MRALAIIVGAIAAGWSSSSLAQPGEMDKPSRTSAFLVGEIRIEGLQRITEGTVFNYLPINIGDELTASRAAEALRALYRTKLFRDIELRREGSILIVAVAERPTIESFEIKGNKDIKTEDLDRSLKSVGLASGKAFDQAVSDEVKQYLTEQYYSRGKYEARVDVIAEPLPGNKVKVAIDIHEGKRARIQQINVVGNTAFADEQLLDVLASRTPNWLSWYKQDDRYAKEVIASDLEKVRSYYLDRGYANFEIASSQVSIAPEKDDIFVTVNVDEGEVYELGDVTIAGSLVLPPETLRSYIRVSTGEIYSQRTIAESVEAIQHRLGLDGYAFATVDPVPRLDPTTRTVALAFVVDAGSRAYVRRINFFGATSVNDNVLRREMRQHEGAYLSDAAVERSKIRLQRLPFIEAVETETSRVPGTPDLVDLDFRLKEGLPGQFGAGIGYSASQALTLSANFTHTNVFGSGHRVALDVNGGADFKGFSLSHTDPYVTPDGIARTVSVSYREVQRLTTSFSEFSTATFASDISFAYPISELQALHVGASYQYAELATTFASSDQVLYWVRNNGDPFESEDILGTRFDTFELSLGWSRDSRNRVLFPTSGSAQRLQLVSSLPIGADAVRYARATFDYEHYFRFGSLPLLDRLPLRFNLNLGYATVLGDTTAIAPNRHFFAGGPNSVRGFDDHTLGPRDSNGNPYGGDLLIAGQLEIALPLPQKWASSARVAAFFDFGQTFYEGDTPFTDRSGAPTDYRFDLGELRTSTGIGVEWLAPLGLFRFSYAVPLRYREETSTQYGDEIKEFQFSIGRAF